MHHNSNLILKSNPNVLLKIYIFSKTLGCRETLFNSIDKSNEE
jgi:hypothetical protein